MVSSNEMLPSYAIYFKYLLTFFFLGEIQFRWFCIERLVGEYQSHFNCCIYSELQVRLVGRMLGKIERVTDVQFTLDDGTGKIDVNRWQDALYCLLCLADFWIVP